MVCARRKTFWSRRPHGRGPDPHQRAGVHAGPGAARGRSGRGLPGAGSLAVGSREEVGALRGSGTVVADLGGRLVLPGFCDAHLHPRYCTCEAYEADLSRCLSVAACAEAVGRFAAAHPELPVVRGFGWYPTQVHEAGMTASVLDAVVPDRPVSLFDDSQHTQWVNSVTLQRLGLGTGEPGWEGAVVERLADGSPSGVLREAWPWVEAALPQYDAAATAAALRRFQREVAARYGLTLLHEAGLVPGETMLGVYLALEEEGGLTARYCVSLELDPGRPATGAGRGGGGGAGPLHGPAGPRRRRQALRRRRDRVAHRLPEGAVRRPAGRPRRRPCGNPRSSQRSRWPRPRPGSSCTTTPSGTPPSSLSLDAIAAARPEGRRHDARDILTHLQLVDPADYGRMAALGVTAAVQPYWFAKDAAYDAELYRPFLGEWRAARQYPLRSLLRHGVLVAGASDYPVSPPPDPLLAIQRGALRRDPQLPETSSELWPEEAVSVQDLVTAFTINGARANHLEGETGSLDGGQVRRPRGAERGHPAPARRSASTRRRCVSRSSAARPCSRPRSTGASRSGEPRRASRRRVGSGGLRGRR